MAVRRRRTNMASYNEGKLEVIEYIMSLAPESILDVGACDGKWAQLLRSAGYTGRLDACEAFKPNAAKILELYDDVFVGDIRRYEYGNSYDVAIFGDVIEHMDVQAAQFVLDYAAHNCKEVIVGVPFLYQQGEIYGNPYERHIQDDLTPEIFEERYGMIGFEMFVRPRGDYAYYRMRRVR